MAHELAHVAVGMTNDPHGPEWERVFSAIHREFERLVAELLERRQNDGP